MKPKYFLFILILTLTSCDPANYDISINIPFNMTLDVNQNGKEFNVTKVLDPNTNPKFKENSSKINDAKINEIIYTITEFEGPATQTANSTFEVADADGVGKINIGSFSNINLSSSLNKPTLLTQSSEALKAVADFVKKSPNKFTVYHTGSVNEGPVKLKVKLEFKSVIATRVL